MKVQYAEVKVKIAKIESSSEAFDTVFMKDIASGNELEVVNKINELNQLFEEMGNAYKQILRKNNQSVRTTLTELHKAELTLSSSIQAN